MVKKHLGTRKKKQIVNPELEIAQRAFGRFVSVSGTVEQLSKDFKELNFREFNKKYKKVLKKSFTSNERLRGTQRRIVNEFNKNNLPAGKVLGEAYLKSVIKPKKKIITKVKFFQKKKYAKKKGYIKFKKIGKLTMKQWLYPYSIWDVKMQNFSQEYVKCKRAILRLKDAFIMSPSSGFQSVYMKVLVEFNDKHGNITYTDWVRFSSKTSFFVPLIQLLKLCERDFITWISRMLKKESSKNLRILNIRVGVIRGRK